MKTLAQYIYESDNNTVKLLKTLKYEVNPNSIASYDRLTRVKLNDPREKAIINTINNAEIGLTAMSIDDWSNGKDNRKKSLINLTEGDIVVKNDKTCEELFIDVKIADKYADTGVIGSIDLNSIVNFANKDNHIYMCMNNNGSDFKIFDGKEVYKYFTSTKELIMSKNRTNEMSEYNGKVKIIVPSSNNFKTTDNDANKVFAEDFLGMKHLIKIKTL